MGWGGKEQAIASVCALISAPPFPPHIPPARQYSPKRGDDAYPISPGVNFQSLPEDWNCPVCNSGKEQFVSKQKQVAGFAQNQGYGLGTNSMTSEQKSLLIFGSLAFFVFLFLAGYLID